MNNIKHSTIALKKRRNLDNIFYKLYLVDITYN